MNRRDILAAVPAMAMMPCAAASRPMPNFMAGSGNEDPILPHYREWLAAKTQWWRWCEHPGNGNWDFPESVDADRREEAAFEAMMRTPATTMEGMAALAHVLWNVAGPSACEDTAEFEEQCRKYEFQPALALWRSATGQDGLPPSFYLQWRKNHASH